MTEPELNVRLPEYVTVSPVKVVVVWAMLKEDEARTIMLTNAECDIEPLVAVIVIDWFPGGVVLVGDIVMLT